MVTLLPDPNSVSIADTHDCRNNCHHHGTMGHESPTNLPNCTVRMSSYRTDVALARTRQQQQRLFSCERRHASLERRDPLQDDSIPPSPSGERCSR